MQLGRLPCKPKGEETGHITVRSHVPGELKKHAWVKEKHRWSYGCLSTCVVSMGWTIPPPAMYNVKRSILMLTYNYRSLYMRYIEQIGTQEITGQRPVYPESSILRR